jgi:hypothetical protein
MKKKFAEAQIAVSTILSTLLDYELATHSFIITWKGGAAAF